MASKKITVTPLLNIALDLREAQAKLELKHANFKKIAPSAEEAAYPTNEEEADLFVKSRIRRYMESWVDPVIQRAISWLEHLCGDEKPDLMISEGYNVRCRDSKGEWLYFGLHQDKKDAVKLMRSLKEAPPAHWAENGTLDTLQLVKSTQLTIIEEVQP